MKKHAVKNNHSSVISFVSLLLLFFATGFLTFRQFKLPNEVKAVAGTLKINAPTGTQTLASPDLANLNVAGNVGIGTSTPAVKLSVVGSGSAYRLNLQSDVSGGLYSGISFGDATGGSTYGAIKFQNDNVNENSMRFLTWSAGAIERMTILGNGNVGIGTSTPAVKLEISGGNFMVVNNTSGITASKVLINPSSYGLNTPGGSEGYFAQVTDNAAVNKYGVYTYVRGSAGTKYNFYAEGGDSSTYSFYSTSTASVLYNAGNVGIGLTSPTNLLHIKKDQNAQTRIRIENYTSGSTAATELAMFNDLFAQTIVGIWSSTTTANGALTAGAGYLYNNGTVGLVHMADNASGTIKFATGGTTERMRIDSSGNVGIGTTAPTSLLTLGGATNKSMRVTSQSSNAAFFGAYIDYATFSVNRDTATGAVADATKAAAEIVLSSAVSDSMILFTTTTTNNSSPIERMRIDKNGNVGIGTTAPGATLDVNGQAVIRGETGYDLRTRFLVGKASGGSGDGGLWIQYGRAQDVTIGDGTNASNLNIQKGTINAYGTGNSTFGGNVGIGTTNPGSRLEVWGDTKIYNSSAASWRTIVGTSDGTNYAVQYTLGVGTSTNQGWYEAYRVSSKNLDFDYHNGTSWFSALHLLPGGGHSDIAEKYNASEPTAKGDLVSIDNFSDASTVKITTKPYDKNLIGIVSTRPGIAINGFNAGTSIGSPEHNPLKPMIAIAGRVPVKIITSGESINLGDEITSSSLKGYGMRAIQAGRVVGKTLETFIPSASCFSVSSVNDIIWPDDQGENERKPCFKLPDGTYVGKVIVMINPIWYDPDVYLTDTGGLIIENNAGANQYAVRNTTTNSLMSRIGAFAQLVVGKIKAGIVETKKLVVDGVDILKKLTELSAKVETQQKQIDDLKKAIEEMKK